MTFYRWVWIVTDCDCRRSLSVKISHQKNIFFQDNGTDVTFHIAEKWFGWVSRVSHPPELCLLYWEKRRLGESFRASISLQSNKSMLNGSTTILWYRINSLNIPRPHNNHLVARQSASGCRVRKERERRLKNDIVFINETMRFCSKSLSIRDINILSTIVSNG